MLIPYKVDNPSKGIPQITLGLIIANILVYAATTTNFLVINDEALLKWAYLSGQPSLISLFTHLFLHINIFHFVGNMYFLWLFSRSVEGRLGPTAFLLIYFIAGIAGGLVQGIFIRTFAAEQGIPILGASGAIMGVMGAYLYMFPWSRVHVFYWFFLPGTFEVMAFWVIGSYFLLDVIGGLISGLAKASKGVGNLAHLFGLITGFLFCKAIRAKRDTEALSNVKATLSNPADFSEMSYWNLLTVLGAEPDNIEALKTLMDRAGGEAKKESLDRAMRSAGPDLIQKAPALVADYLTSKNGDMEIYQPKHILKLASIMKAEGRHEDALRLYEMLVQCFPNSEDAEMVFFRMAQIQWDQFKDATAALSSLYKMQSHFPNSSLSSTAQTLRRDIQKSSKSQK